MPPKDRPLNVPVTELSGVGRERAAQLARLGIRTVEELLLHRPRRYEDRRHLRTICELQAGTAATTSGRIVAQGVTTLRRRTRSFFEFILEDGTGRLHCRWWNLPYMEKYFAVGDEVLVYGKLRSLKPRTIDHPETEVIDGGEERFIHLDRIAPLYPLTEGISQRWLRGLIWRTLAGYSDLEAQGWPGPELDGLPDRGTAVRLLHFPDTLPQAERARQRLALDEFLEMQLAIQRRRQHLETRAQPWPCGGDNRLQRPFLRQLGFVLTPAQTRVLRELRTEMSGTRPMRRLVQGDVGSGKTVVAACCGLMAIESGFNVALMAPTEILAEQHFSTFTRWLRPLGVPVQLVTGERKTWKPADKNQRELDAIVSRPPELPGLWIGTHALIQASFDVPRLALVIIDEQHKFGVTQRESLVRKGCYPHLLVMTATPIPRTLGLTLYGDLDISSIDQLPSGRGRVRTFVRASAQLPKVHAFVKQQLAEGRQAYVVYPRIEDEEHASGLKAVRREYQQLQVVFAPHATGLLHGRLRPEERERVMTAFRAGELKVLLATSVIEVGVDVPNATIMVIENADRFGLAQLHQLRGRIGRGAHESFCVLVSDSATDEAKERLEVMASTQDGFAIAEADLRLRGPGELLGQEQSGLPSLRFGDLAADGELVERARAWAKQHLNQEFNAPATTERAHPAE